MNTKRLLWALSLVCAVFVLGYVPHSYFLGCLSKPSNCPVFPHYIFHFSFAIAVAFSFVFMANQSKMYAQLGFIYLGALAFKLLLYAALFRNILLARPEDSPVSEGHLLIPVFVGLLCEIIIIKKLLNNS